MKNMSLEKIAQACGGVYHGSEEMKQSIVESITTDSRQAAKGCLFVAIPGERVDGHDFIPSVFEKGALAVLSEKELENPAIWASPAQLTVVQMQDLLGLDRRARMNTPSTLGGNWQWRALPEAISAGLARRLYREAAAYQRLPRGGAAKNEE